MKKPTEKKTSSKREKFIEGIDFYYENGLMILTAEFLNKRGFCCENNCRNCPYQKNPAENLEQKNI